MLDPIDIRYFKMAVGSKVKYETPGDICVRCPICGDSKYSKNKARLHLYSKGSVTLVNCFNECSCRNKTVYKFLRDYYPALLPSYKQEKFSNNLTKVQLENLDLIGDFEIPETDTSTLPQPPVLFDLNFFEVSHKTDEYLESRGIHPSEVFGQLYIGKDITIDGKHFPVSGYIIIPFYCGGRCYGFYSRSMKEHRFYTYMPEKNVDFKVWNYYNINRAEPVYVFEGIFDAMSAHQAGITNVVACCGATPPDSLLEGLDCVMCFDNDRTGKSNALKYAKKGYKVLVYPDNLKYKDFNEMLVSGVNISDIISAHNIYAGICAQVKLCSQM